MLGVTLTTILNAACLATSIGVDVTTYALYTECIVGDALCEAFEVYPMY